MFAKSSILDDCRGSKYASVYCYHQYFYFLLRLLLLQLATYKKISIPNSYMHFLPNKSQNCWDRVFKSGPCKMCGRQPLKKQKVYDVLK